MAETWSTVSTPDNNASYDYYLDCDNVTSDVSVHVDPFSVTFATCYALICAVGMVGNALVIYVIVRFNNMQTVTNTYILNLAVADLCFIIGLPFLIVTSMLRAWIFGNHMCKIFMILTGINWFTSVFTLTVMSADRFLAVCYPITSMAWRTPFKSRLVCLAVWVLSMLAMSPIMVFARAKTHPDCSTSCTIDWPSEETMPSERGFVIYTLLLAFVIPVPLICVFYGLVLVRLRSVGPQNKSKEKKRSHRKVTKMVLTVIVVYVACWLPYWVFQVAITTLDRSAPRWVILTFMFITVLSYANSMLNPFIYAFLSQNFRKSFVSAFQCLNVHETNKALKTEVSQFPGGRNNGKHTSPTSALIDTKTVGTTTCVDHLESETVFRQEDQTAGEEEEGVRGGYEAVRNEASDETLVREADRVMSREEKTVHERLLPPPHTCS